MVSARISCMQDLRYALRLLRRNPGFTAVAVLALALGIGANTAIFSVVDALLLQQLPYHEPHRIVMVWEDVSVAGFPRNTPAPANWVDWRKQNTVFTDIAASRGATYVLTGEGAPEQVTGRRATASFWSVMGTKPVVGRTFTEEEDQKAAKVAVISHGLWMRRFGGDPKILGRKILLSDEPFEVIGVMPSQFVDFIREFDIWTPFAPTPELLARRGSHFLFCVARMKPGVTIEQARAEMNTIAKRLELQYPDTNKDIGAVVVPLREQIVGDKLHLALLVLMAASACVLLIACANLANLLLARASGRAQEIAVRAALGAGRGRLIRQMLSESLLLAGLGALFGLALARVGMVVLEKLIPAGIAMPKLSLDWRVLVFTAAISVLTGILFGLAPAWSVSRTDFHDSLKQGGRGAAGTRRNWFRDALVVGEMALALVLLTGAGLMIRTLDNLQKINTGMRIDHLMTLTTNLPSSRYGKWDQRDPFFTNVLDKVRAIPGVMNAGYTSVLPLTAQGNTNSYLLEGQTPNRGIVAQNQDALFRVVTPGFFATIGAQLREGRGFTMDDRSNTMPIAVINETFADRHFPNQSPIGKRFKINFSLDPPITWITIVGVVREIRERGFDIDTKPAMYMPQAQAANYWPIPQDLVIRTTVVPESILPAVRQAIWSVDKDQPISRARTMEQVADIELSPRKQQMTLLSVFAGLALLLASIGIYGVLAYAVAQRTQEIGVRMSLGATPGNIAKLVAGRGLGLTLGGLAIGLAGSLALGRLMSAMLYKVQGQDWATLAAVSLMLLLVALAACLIPARRASRVDPLVALRSE